MIPQMKARGYGADYAVNVTSMAALIALLLPPSHNMIIYSISGGGNISIADLFTAGIIPGLLLALALSITAYIVARRRGYPTEPFPGFARGRRSSSLVAPRPAADRASSSAACAPASSPRPRAPASPCSTRCSSRSSSTAARAGATSSTPPRRGAHHLDGAADHRHGRRLRLADGLPAGAGADDRPDGRHLPGPAPHPADDQHHPAGARHLHGHGAADHHHHADLPAGGAAPSASTRCTSASS